MIAFNNSRVYYYLVRAMRSGPGYKNGLKIVFNVALGMNLGRELTFIF